MYKRQVLAAWIADESKRAGEIHPAADNNWRLAPIAGDKKLDIRFETSPSDLSLIHICKYASCYNLNPNDRFSGERHHEFI